MRPNMSHVQHKLLHDVNHCKCSGMIPNKVVVFVSNSLQSWASKHHLLLIP